jgi:hypothetical protein
VFPSKSGLRLPHSGLHTLCRGLNPAITIHGFRSTFRDWVGDETDFDSEAAEFCLSGAPKAPIVAKRALRNAAGSCRPGDCSVIATTPGSA